MTRVLRALGLIAAAAVIWLALPATSAQASELGPGGTTTIAPDETTGETPGQGTTPPAADSTEAPGPEGPGRPLGRHDEPGRVSRST